MADETADYVIDGLLWSPRSGRIGQFARNAAATVERLYGERLRTLTNRIFTAVETETPRKYGLRATGLPTDEGSQEDHGTSRLRLLTAFRQGAAEYERKVHPSMLDRAADEASEPRVEIP